MKKPPVDRKKQTNSRIVRCIVLIVALILYFMSAYTYFQNEQLKERATLVESEVIYIDERTGESAKDVYIEYFYDGQIYGFQYDKDYGSTYTLGDKVLLYIDPAHPEKQVDVSGAGMAILLWCCGGAILMAVCIGMNERKASEDYCTAFSLTKTYIHADLLRKLKYDRAWLLLWVFTLSAGGLCYLCIPYRKIWIGAVAAAGVLLCMAVAATWQHCKIAGSVKSKNYRTENVRVTKKEIHEDADSTDYVVLCIPEGKENEQYTVRVTRKEHALVEIGDEMLLVCLGYRDMPYLCISLKDKKVFYQTGCKRRK